MRKKYYFIANDRMLDFVNTNVRDSFGQPLDLLESLPDYVEWLRIASVISKDQGEEILARWTALSDRESIMKAVRDFRNILHSMVSEVIAKRKISASYLAEINHQLSLRVGGDCIVQNSKSFTAIRLYNFNHPIHFTAPIAEAAIHFLTNCRHGYVRKCKNPDCVLVFYDTSKSHRRQWCAMSECGNRAKAAQFYKRHQH